MEPKFRNLTANEISVEVASVNTGGVRLLLWKKNLATNRILDETVGVLGWQMELTNENKNCILSIYDKDTGNWVKREGVGDKPKMKSLVADALSHAATQFGIGIELYTAPEIFIFKSDLKGYKKEDSGELHCTDRFVVTDIKYNEKQIISVTIGVKEYEGSDIYYTKTFTQKNVPVTPSQTGTASKPKTLPDKEELDDDDVILIGYQSGRKYKEVKNTESFKKFLEWVAKSTSVYNDAKKDQQLAILKKMAAKM